MMKYFHVDVFTEQAMNGNGLTVVFPERELESETLLKIAQEFKQFETIFIYPPNEDVNFPVRIFTIEEELAFAGHPILEQFLETFGAKFVYVFETDTLECRTWDNSGVNEDVATGSAAGPLCAYLVRNGFAEPDQVISISQGSFLKRPSIIKGWVHRETGHVLIQGSVFLFGKGEIFTC